MADSLVLIRDTFGREYMVRQSNYVRFYQSQGYSITSVVGDGAVDPMASYAKFEQVDSNGNEVGGAATLITGAGFASAFAAASAPASSATGGQTVAFRRVRTHITYAGTVTSAAIRLYTRINGVGTPWFRGPSSDDDTPLTPSASMLAESRDWLIGVGVEFLFALESIAPGSVGNTVAVDAVGVNA